MPGDVEKLEVQMAEFRGAVNEQLKNLAHDVKNIAAALPALVPRHEMAEAQEHRKETHEALKYRVTRLESHITWLVRTVGAAIIAGLFVALRVFGAH